ncbi:histone-arginine methyltransferase CARMER isoform X2 [Cimex lectularius]|uniref:type I protein arginine methyltransferase n=1 Tax=Cimex lectularius TaxID=79782 RepID=A0A8I6RPY2_CIMLE|nr:histone-arginine methyltransferase CARMER isoform X2 [Cimex lectularius]
MARVFSPVFVSKAGTNGEMVPKFDSPVTLTVDYDPQGFSAKLKKDPSDMNVLLEFPIHRFTECSRIGQVCYIFMLDGESTLLRFKDEYEMKKFHALVNEVKIGKGTSVFSERTDDSSAIQYFQFYGYLSQQQNMLQDYVRTSTYQKAVLSNSEDFRDKVVLDVGAGSGILSFFAVQAGAKKVYAVEASSMAQHAEALVAANNFQDKIKVIAGKIEEIDLPEQVDVIISEPMGYMLYNERMLETYLHAKKWLKPGGIMFPSKGDLHIAPFMDDALFIEQTNKASFWVQTCFHGVDLSAMKDAATKEYFRQPIVDTFDMRICMAKSIRHSVDFTVAEESDLHKIVIPLEFYMLETGTVHGLAFWFDVAFTGTNQTVWLSTSPTEALTHWYQVRCLLESPLFAKAGQLLTGTVTLQANQRQSYDVTIDLAIEGVDNLRSVNTLDLKNPYFRYTGQPVVPPPGTNTISPSEAYWSALDAQAVNMVNGISVNGLGEVSLDGTANQNGTNLIGLVSQPNIHPGSITSTGRQRASTFCQGTQTPNVAGVGGIITPTIFSAPTASQLVIGQASHFPVNNSLMIGDYVTPGNNVLSVHGYRQ